MKKSKIYIIACLIILSGIIIYFISYQSKTSDQECGTPIPSCYVLEHDYYTHYDREEDRVNKIEDGFQFYGTINEHIQSSEYCTLENKQDLSTNTSYYIDKDIYVNKEDKRYIYVRMSENNYSILYYDDRTENEVLKIIQQNNKN